VSFRPSPFIGRRSVVFKAMDKLVAQVSNLLYRSASSLRARQVFTETKAGDALPIGNRRYSRLETCATFQRAAFGYSPGLIPLF